MCLKGHQNVHIAGAAAVAISCKPCTVTCNDMASSSFGIKPLTLPGNRRSRKYEGARDVYLNNYLQQNNQLYFVVKIRATV